MLSETQLYLKGILPNEPEEPDQADEGDLDELDGEG